MIQTSTSALVQSIQRNGELTSGKICQIHALKDWVVIPAKNKRDWYTKAVYVNLKKKLPVSMVILVAKLIKSLQIN